MADKGHRALAHRAIGPCTSFSAHRANIGPKPCQGLIGPRAWPIGQVL